MDAPRNDLAETAGSGGPRSRRWLTTGIALLTVVAALTLASVFASNADDPNPKASTGGASTASADPTATPSGRVERATFAMG